MERRIRSPIMVVLGHVDVGKTTLLDKIRGTAVAYREPGTMTQHIGASFLPWSALEKVCGSLMKLVKKRINIPGLLVIDTPGHEAFVNLRKRGGSIADIAILVIDVRAGFEKQTYESIEILRSRKTPFIVAVNKIDKIPGWKSNPFMPFIQSIKLQKEDVAVRLEEYLYRIMNELRRLGFRSDRYDRIKDFTRVIALVPISALTGEGIPDLLMVLAGIAQRFMINKLYVEDGPAKGVVLEVKEEVGLGTTIDAIIYDGRLRKGDTIVVGGISSPIITKVRAILIPKPLDEMRSPEDRLKQIDEIIAAVGIKIAAPNLSYAVAGAPIFAVWDKLGLNRAVEEVKREVESIKRFKDINGILVKADTLGSLEALVGYLENQGIPVRYADIGAIVKKDIIEASLVRREDKYHGVILAFNVKITNKAKIEAKRNGIKIFMNNIIYRLVEEYLNWLKESKKMDAERIISQLVLPARIKILPGYVFRRRNPVIVGIKILNGRIRPGFPLMRKDGKVIGAVMQIQEHGENLQEATKDMEVAISIRGNIMIGRQVKEGDILFTDVPFDHIEKLLQLKEFLSAEEIDLLKDIEKLKINKLRNQ